MKAAYEIHEDVHNASSRDQGADQYVSVSPSEEIKNTYTEVYYLIYPQTTLGR